MDKHDENFYLDTVIIKASSTTPIPCPISRSPTD
jgi:hypothetical protein